MIIQFKLTNSVKDKSRVIIHTEYLNIDIQNDDKAIIFSLIIINPNKSSIWHSQIYFFSELGICCLIEYIISL